MRRNYSERPKLLPRKKAGRVKRQPRNPLQKRQLKKKPDAKAGPARFRLSPPMSVPTPENIKRCLIELARERGSEKTFCPSEAARRLNPKSWRPLMITVRQEAALLIQNGELVCTQKGEEIDITTARGPIRLSLVQKSSDSSSA